MVEFDLMLLLWREHYHATEWWVLLLNLLHLLPHSSLNDNCQHSLSQPLCCWCGVNTFTLYRFILIMFSTSYYFILSNAHQHTTLSPHLVHNCQHCCVMVEFDFTLLLGREHYCTPEWWILLLNFALFITKLIRFTLLIMNSYFALCTNILPPSLSLAIVQPRYQSPSLV